MKKSLLPLIFWLLPLAAATAQVPDGFSFQAIARDASGNLLTGKQLTVLIGIRSGSPTGSLVWEESHIVGTNEFGLFDLVVCGDNALRTGGSAASVSDIAWSSGSHFINLKINAGSGFVDLGTTALRSVPYSMATATVSQNLSSLSVQPQKPTDPGEALFMVSREDGYPVFAVYEDGVWVYTDTAENAKGTKGGFAVGGYKKQNKGPARDYLRVTPDSTMIYIESDPLKGVKGGFAVGGYSKNKSPMNEFMRVTRDSTRIYVNSDPAKGVKGGFAVGGYTTGNKGEEAFLSLRRDNYFIGHNSGSVLTTGLFNSTLGYESGMNITSGESNAFIGYQSGYRNTSGSGNLFLGYQAGYANIAGNYNTFLGYLAGNSNSAGTNNTFLGSFTGMHNTGGNYNTFVGDSTGFNNSTGSNNTFLGTKAGYQNTLGYSNVFLGNSTGYNNNGNFNVFIGHNSGFSNKGAWSNVFIGNEAGFLSTEGWNNIYIGTDAGRNSVDAEGNVFVGYQSGLSNQHGKRNVFIGNWSGYDEKGSNRLYITNFNSDSTRTLIWGDFQTGTLRFNNTVGIGIHPVNTTFSVFDHFGAGSITVQGAGNTYDYSIISLKGAPGEASEKMYNLSHTTSNNLVLVYLTGTDYFPRMLISKNGNISLNTWDEGTQVLDVNGNARFRAVGSAASAFDLRITADGTLTTSSSDARLKNDLREIQNSLDKVLKMKGYTFSWSGETNGRRDAGLIAQEVAEIFPEAVFVNPSDGLYGINYSRFPALFVEAFREQQTIIDEQATEISRQDEEIEELKQRLEKLEQLLLK
ncbi:MAG: tail fiber domain-containing protein [Bacteroidota bacterium]